MSHERPLQGACSCGRNRYIIIVPENTTERPHIFFDDSSENRTIRPDFLNILAKLTFAP
jgi:hypothetical protein